MDLAKGATEDSLKEIQDDIDYFLKSDDEKKKDKSKESDEENENNDTNPFTALLGIDKLKIFEKKSGKKKSSEEEKKERAEKLSKEGIKPDTYAESMLRKLAEANAIDSCYSIYNTYKKGHGMATTREPV
jgi:hypothetical protein